MTATNARTNAGASSGASQSVVHRALQHRWVGLLALLVINGVIIAGVDFVLVKLDLIRPNLHYGDADVGFGGRLPFFRSSDFGVAQSFADSSGLVIAMVGDSHSELDESNALSRHQFLFESILRASDVPAIAIAAGRGKYSPLQEYLLYKLRIKKDYQPRIVVMNFYTGNDFHDILRPDDRPHFARTTEGSIEIREPVWLAYANPDARTWRDQSRLLWTLNALVGELGYPNIYMRIKMLTATARDAGGGTRDVFGYVSAIRRSIEPRLEYNAGFSAQMLNQAIFFDYFPEAKTQSLRFIVHLMRMAKEENPGVLFVLSPIPSAALAHAMPPAIEPYWQDTLERVGTTQDAVYELEAELYEELRSAATETGWVFVDLLSVFQRNPHGEVLFTESDLHVNQASCRLIADEEARVLQRILDKDSSPLPH